MTMLGALIFLILSTVVLGHPQAANEQLTLTLPQAPEVVSPAREPLFQAPGGIFYQLHYQYTDWSSQL